ncbi:MAG: ATP-dependent helicase [Hungatella sp.]|nr:ATP-dependent helicase [Hungatella sp.]
MEVSAMETKAFWKGEVGVSGQVRDGNAVYKVMLEVKGSYVNSCSCSCAMGNSYKGLCPHERALLDHYLAHGPKDQSRAVTTSSQARTMIREYTDREVAQILGESGEGRIRFLPRLLLGRQEIKAEFRLEQKRQYIIKDLGAFARAMDQGESVEYGKNLSFCHTMDAFAPESRPLLAMVLEEVAACKEHYEQFHKSIYAPMAPFRELNISRSIRDRFFDLLTDQQVESETPGGVAERFLVTRRNPEKIVTVAKLGSGISVSVDREIFSFSGERFLYVAADGFLYVCDEAFTRDGAVFFGQMTQGYGAPYQVTISEKDCPLFYERVLRNLERHGLLDVRDVDLLGLRPEKLTARFELENPAPGQVVCRPVLSYGAVSFHPAQGDKAPRTVCRDVPGEFRISQVLTAYFQYRDPVTNDLMIQDDEDALFRLLSQGIPKMQKLGQVYFPQGERAFKLLDPPKVSVGVQVSHQWLDLTIDAGSMTGRDMGKLLEAYRKKKPYYRLKTGEFLRLEDNGLLAVARMVDGLALTKQELGQATVKIPKYRALFLDCVCGKRQDVVFTKDYTYQALIRGMEGVGDKTYSVPKEMELVLREYQKAGFQWLKTLDSWGFGGILADDMGLGKTIQVICVLLDQAQREKAMSLIVCPASLVYNWESEMERFAPSLKTLLVTGPSREREEMLAHAQEYDVVVTSYDLLRRDLHLYEGLSFRFQVIDEAQYIKNPGTQNARAVKSVRAATRYALTGTPVENRLGELWSIFDYLMPGFLYSYQKFKKAYEGPIVKDGDEETLKRLLQMTGPFILRRLKRDVLEELPGKLESVVYSRMDGEQKDLYAANVWHLKKQMAQQNKIEILSGLTRLRQVCCDPRLVYEDYRGGSAKLETCMDLVRSGILAGHRILLFSQFTSMLHLIGQQMERDGIAFSMLTGETPKEERARLVSRFGTDDAKVFLISLKAGGTGLNLTAADMVIHYDPWWNVAAQNQATDRAHRIGQEKEVVVFKLITRDTIEENIMKLQKAKEMLADQVVTEGMVSLGSLSQAQIMELLGT